MSLLQPIGSSKNMPGLSGYLPGLICSPAGAKSTLSPYCLVLDLGPTRTHALPLPCPSPLTLRLLAETGRHTQSPIFSIGLFLPSGLKLAEGHGSSLAMAEHRAAVNALHSLYLVRSDSGAAAGASIGGQSQLPTEAHGQWALEAGKVGRGVVLRGQGIGGGKEVVAGSARR